MLRALALLLTLVAATPALAAGPAPSAPSPLACDMSQPGETMQALCALPQLAAANCPQTCYDDQNVCRNGCDKAYRSGPDHDKCVSACSTTYGRCQMRCNAPQR